MAMLPVHDQQGRLVGFVQTGNQLGARCAVVFAIGRAGTTFRAGMTLAVSRVEDDLVVFDVLSEGP